METIADKKLERFEFEITWPIQLESGGRVLGQAKTIVTFDATVAADAFWKADKFGRHVFRSQSWRVNLLRHWPVGD